MNYIALKPNAMNSGREVGLTILMNYIALKHIRSSNMNLDSLTILMNYIALKLPELNLRRISEFDYPYELHCSQTRVTPLNTQI